MYTVTEAFRQQMKNPVLQFRLRGEITHAAGGGVFAVERFTENNVREGSFTISNSVSGTDRVQIGTVNIGTMEAIFTGLRISRYKWDNAKIVPRVGLVLPDASVEYVPMGVFTVPVGGAENVEGGVKITAYDNMQRLTRPAVPAMFGVRTPWRIISVCASRCGVEFAQTQAEIEALPNGAARIYLDSDNDISSYQDIMYWIAQLMGCYLTARRDGKLEFRPYSRTVVDTLSNKQRFSGAVFADYETRYTAVTLETKETLVQRSRDPDEEDEYSEIEVARRFALPVDDGLEYALGKNPFLALDTPDVQEARARVILNALQAVRYVPFSAETASPAYDLGDVFRFTDGRADGTKLSCVTGLTWTYNGACKLEGAGEDPHLATAKNAAQKAASAIRNSLNSSGGFLTVRNPDAVSVADGGRETVLSASLSCGGETHVLAQAQIELTTATTITQNQDGSTTVDLAEATAFWRIDNAVKVDDTPPQILMDGPHIMALLYDFMLPAGARHTVDVLLAMAGGAAAVDAGKALLTLRDNNRGSGGIDEEIPDWEEPDEDAEAWCMYIAVTAPPEKTEYHPGETLDYTGLEITAYYSDGTTADVTGECTMTPGAGQIAQATGPLEILVLYNGVGDRGDGQDFWGRFDLRVISRVQSTVVRTMPTKTTYEYGDPIDYMGVKIVAVMDDGTEIDITDECVFSPAEGEPAFATGYTPVSATYYGEDLGTLFDIYVFSVQPKMLYVYPNRFSFASGIGGDAGYYVDIASGAGDYPSRFAVDVNAAERTITVRTADFSTPLFSSNGCIWATLYAVFTATASGYYKIVWDETFIKGMDIFTNRDPRTIEAKLSFTAPYVRNESTPLREKTYLEQGESVKMEFSIGSTGTGAYYDWAESRARDGRGIVSGIHWTWYPIGIFFYGADADEG